jgi:hypothetical protein
MSELQPAQNNLSAIFLAACGTLPAPAAILGSAVRMTGAQRVVSRKLTKSIAAGVAAIAIAGGSYGIVSATSSGSSAAASSGTAGSRARTARQGRRRTGRAASRPGFVGAAAAITGASGMDSASGLALP